MQDRLFLVVTVVLFLATVSGLFLSREASTWNPLDIPQIAEIGR